MSAVAWAATLLSLVYLWLAIRNRAACFVFGAMASLLWAYESYYVYHLVFDGCLQIFYVVMSLIGIYRWQQGGTGSTEKPITNYSKIVHLGIVLLGVVASSLLIYVSQYIDIISLPILDATTTVYLIIGTLLLVERELYSWVYLVIADLAYIYIYGSQGAWLFAVMMLIYSVFGIVGFMEWRKIVRK